MDNSFETIPKNPCNFYDGKSPFDMAFSCEGFENWKFLLCMHDFYYLLSYVNRAIVNHSNNSNQANMKARKSIIIHLPLALPNQPHRCANRQSPTRRQKIYGAMPSGSHLVSSKLILFLAGNLDSRSARLSCQTSGKRHVEYRYRITGI